MSPVMAKGSLCMKGDPKNPKFIFLLCFYSYTFKLQSPSKYSPFDAIHWSRCFFHSSKQFWTHQFWCLLVFLPFFVSPLPQLQNISLWGLFSSRETKKKLSRASLGKKEGWGIGSHTVFGQKLLTTQCGVGRCAHKSLKVTRLVNARSGMKSEAF